MEKEGRKEGGKSGCSWRAALLLALPRAAPAAAAALPSSLSRPRNISIVALFLNVNNRTGKRPLYLVFYLHLADMPRINDGYGMLSLPLYAHRYRFLGKRAFRLGKTTLSNSDVGARQNL